jgi:hypothetical protein
VSKVILEYPNGRRHEIDDFDSEHHLKVGYSFDLYGRRWRVISVASQRKPGNHRYLHTDGIVCRPITDALLGNANTPGTID